MEGATRAATPAMATNIRRVLSGLHSEKAAPGVDAMLLRVYEPIIFRHVKTISDPMVQTLDMHSEHTGSTYCQLHSMCE